MSCEEELHGEDNKEEQIPRSVINSEDKDG